ncbi:hypothetical protein ACQKFL_01685 [Vreelandella titanicae]|uniref:hypothetical protein n=1 Tax=Vreelandella titanicae TaxID=664683 RepID=UPI003CFE26D2|tara:strand:+ start:936 stop:1592 length:657 start_codon:yes stop_codon:yes gene_type:complete
MKEGLKFSLSVGAFITVVIYVAGFIWQYTYLGVITNDIGWVKIVTTDYLYLGVMAILFVMKPQGWLVLVFGYILIYSGFLDYVAKGVWHDLSFNNKKRLFGWIRFLSFDVSVKRMAAYVFGFFFLLGMSKEITEVAPRYMAGRLISEGVDRVCDKEDSCYKGKVLYIGDKQIYFYNYDGEKNVTDGVLMLMSVADSTVFMGWSERGRGVINSHVSNGS